MNLKQAARELDVHYQTAYRWVRTGTLVAAKIGTSYEISPGSIEACRRAQIRMADGSTTQLTGLFAEIVRSIAGSIVDDEFLINIAVRIAAERIGDAAYYLRIAAPGQMEGLAYFHRDLERQVVASRLLGRPGYLQLTDHHETVLNTGKTMVIDGVSDGPVMASDATFSPFVDESHITAVGLAPVSVNGAPVGVLGLLRERTPAITESEAADLTLLADLLGELLTSSPAKRRAWACRDDLREHFSRLLADTTGSRSLSQVLDRLIEATPDDLLVAVLDAERRFLAVSPALEVLYDGRGRLSMVGARLDDLVPARERGALIEQWETLTGDGHADLNSILSIRSADDSEIHLEIHAAPIRDERRDTTHVLVVSVMLVDPQHRLFAAVH